MKKITAFLLALMLTLTILFVTSCGNEGGTATSQSSVSTTQSSLTDGSSTNDKNEIPAEGLWKDATYRKDTTLGQGEKTITVTVEIEGKSINLTINTNASNVGDALLELGLAEGTTSQTGLYMKKLIGVTADWDIDKSYWAFYINGEYAMAGVSSTDVISGTVYKFVREK